MTLSEKNAAARRLGLSYGKYVALYHPPQGYTEPGRGTVPIKGTCIICGAKLSGRQRKYCSNACKKRSFKSSNMCLICGNPSGRSKYCSEKCRRVVKTQQQREYRARGPAAGGKI